MIVPMKQLEEEIYRQGDALKQVRDFGDLDGLDGFELTNKVLDDSPVDFDNFKYYHLWSGCLYQMPRITMQI